MDGKPAERLPESESDIGVTEEQGTPYSCGKGRRPRDMTSLASLAPGRATRGGVFSRAKHTSRQKKKKKKERKKKKRKEKKTVGIIFFWFLLLSCFLF